MSQERDRSQHQPIPAPLRFIKTKCPACTSGDHGNPKFICPCECHTAAVQHVAVSSSATPTTPAVPPAPPALPPVTMYERYQYVRNNNQRLPDGSAALVRKAVPVEQAGTRIAQIQAEILAWTNHNFGGPSVPIRYQVAPFLGMVEEIGEMAHHMLKDANKIRGSSEQHRAEVKDGLGDLFVFMCGFAAANEISLSDVIETTWEKVSKRDWKKFPENGMTK